MDVLQHREAALGALVFECGGAGLEFWVDDAGGEGAGQWLVHQVAASAW